LKYYRIALLPFAECDSQAGISPDSQETLGVSLYTDIEAGISNPQYLPLLEELKNRAQFLKILLI
jgi:hypothetical protein